jgi:hypothetical protein
MKSFGKWDVSIGRIAVTTGIVVLGIWLYLAFAVLPDGESAKDMSSNKDDVPPAFRVDGVEILKDDLRGDPVDEVNNLPPGMLSYSNRVNSQTMEHPVGANPPKQATGGPAIRFRMAPVIE